MTAQVWAASDRLDTDWTIMLLDVWPDGHAERVQDGLVRARFRRGMDREVPLVRARVERYDIDLWFTSMVFRRGIGCGQRGVGVVPEVRPQPEHRRQQRAGYDVRGGAPAAAARRGAPLARGAAGDTALNGGCRLGHHGTVSHDHRDQELGTAGFLARVARHLVDTGSEYTSHLSAALMGLHLTYELRLHSAWLVVGLAGARAA